MAKSNAQPDSEADWNFSDDEAEAVEKEIGRAHV